MEEIIAADQTMQICDNILKGLSVFFSRVFEMVM